MKYLLVHFEKDWADEFSVKGSALYTEKEWAEQEALFDRHGDLDICVSFGTNEGWEDEPFSSIRDDYETVEIPKVVYDELKALKQTVFGMFKSPEEFIEAPLFTAKNEGADDDDDDWDDEEYDDEDDYDFEEDEDDADE